MNNIESGPREGREREREGEKEEEKKKERERNDKENVHVQYLNVLPCTYAIVPINE